MSGIEIKKIPGRPTGDRDSYRDIPPLEQKTSPKNSEPEVIEDRIDFSGVALNQLSEKNDL